MPYTKQTWVNGAGGGTPVSAARLNYMEDGIEVADSTDAVQDKAALLFTGATHSGVTTVYDDGAATITISIITEFIQDLVGAMFSGNTETGVEVTYDDINGKIDVVVDLAAVNTETIQDIVGDMLSGNVETGIAVTYDDTNNKIDFAAEVTQSEFDTLSATTDQQLKEWTTGEAYEMTAITYSVNYPTVISTATVKWPDASGGTFTATTINSTYLAIDAYTVSHTVNSRTVTQTAVTRNGDGNVTVKPALTVA